MEYLLIVTAVSLYTACSLGLIWLLDRFEKEPIWVLALVFLWGAVPAGLISVVFEAAIESSVSYLFGLDAWVARICTCVAVAPVVEELAKGLALLAVFMLMRHELHGVLDGIVYGAVVGLGFGGVETIEKMCFSFYGTGSSAEPMEFFIGRVGLFGLMHATWTAFTGLGFGVANAIRSRWLGALAVLLGLAAAIAVHAIHNGLCVVGDSQTEPAGIGACFVTLLLFHWLLLLCFFIIIILTWLAQWRWIKSELRQEVLLGNVGERDFRQVAKWFGRLGWELRFLAAFDFAGFFRIRKMFNLLVRLAFARRDYGRDPGEDTRRRLDDARRRVAEMRGKFV